MAANLENSAVATGLEERQPQRKAMPKNAQTYHTIALISHASKVMLKVLHLDSILKSRDITLLTKVFIVKAMVFSSSHVWM